MNVTFQPILVKEILIKDRYRKDQGDIKALAESIRDSGQLMPILVAPLENDSYRLICGERRVRAFNLMKLDKINATIAVDPQVELLYRKMELDENVKRKNFTWQEEVSALEALHELNVKLKGPAVKGVGGGHGLKDTAKELGRSIASISQDLALARAIEQNPQLAKAKSKHHAFKTLAALKEKILSTELSKRKKQEVKLQGFYNENGVSGLRKHLADNSVDLILVDPQFGIDRKATDTEIWTPDDNYDDAETISLSLIRASVPEYARVLKDRSHLFMFYDHKYYDTLVSLFLRYDFIVFEAPIIWNKGSGSSAPLPYSFTRSYESILHCMKGKRELLKSSFDVLNYKRVPPSRRIHPDEKPIDLLAHLIECTTEFGDVVLDNFAGSGSTIRAALSRHRSAIGFELDKTAYDRAYISISETLKIREEVIDDDNNTTNEEG